MVNALEYLHCKMHVIHRDVKPSNILLNRAGDIKLCDYSISGYLVNSLALSIGVGFYPYMAVRILLVCFIVILAIGTVLLVKNCSVVKLPVVCAESSVLLNIMFRMSDVDQEVMGPTFIQFCFKYKICHKSV